MSIPLIGIPLFGIGITEAVIIVGAVLVLFGATRLPKLGRGIGEGIRNFKSGIKGDTEAVTEQATPSDADTNTKQP